MQYVLDPSFSIVIEWENARFAELDRTRQMLRSLQLQLQNIRRPSTVPKIFFLYDKFTIDGNVVQQVIREDFPASQDVALVHITPSEGLRYYQQKNAGAMLSTSEIVIFLDCDVIPEPGWLQGLLDAFADKNVNVVAGETYIEPRTFYGRAFALFWFFHLRDLSDDLRQSHFFHANNVAFRREIFQRYPFPELSTYRGQCSVLGRTLLANGIAIHMQMRSRVSHPCPLGIRYFVGRALNNGRDQVLVSGMDSGTGHVLWRSVYWNFSNSMRRTWLKFRLHGRAVGLNPLTSIAAYGIAFLYFSIKAAGEVATLAHPNIVKRIFPI